MLGGLRNASFKKPGGPFSRNANTGGKPGLGGNTGEECVLTGQIPGEQKGNWKNKFRESEK